MSADMRIQGGTLGILSAIDAGRLDPLDGELPEDRPVVRYSNQDWVREQRRHRAKLRKSKRLAARSPF
jgi:hypothetical protein